MIQLVVNADDLGLHPRIDQGILRAHREGLVTSATLLARGRNAARAVQQAREQGLAVGVHLCLTGRLAPAAPPERVPTVAPNGTLRGDWASLAWAWARGGLELAEVERELRAQLELARSLGAEVDHLDGHQHLHLLPGIAGVVRRLASREGLPLRWPGERPEWGWARRPGAGLKSAMLSALALRSPGGPALPGHGLYDAGQLTEPRLLRHLSRLGEGNHELGCHPGCDPGQVPEDPGWRYQWEAELSALCSPAARRVIEARAIRLTTYRALFGP